MSRNNIHKQFIVEGENTEMGTFLNCLLCSMTAAHIPSEKFAICAVKYYYKNGNLRTSNRIDGIITSHDDDWLLDSCNNTT